MCAIAPLRSLCPGAMPDTARLRCLADSSGSRGNRKPAVTVTHATERLALARTIAESFSRLSEVEAVALGGSTSTGNDGEDSDIDLYVYATKEIPVETRARLIQSRAVRAELDNRFWEPGDEWVEVDSGIAVDVMHRHPAWIEEQLDRVLLRHEASVGYSTAFWHNVRHSVPLFDRRGWFGRLQEKAAQPYPEELVRAIVAMNQPVLRDRISSWLHQLDKAMHRGDVVLANQKLAKLLDSYFDALFALNRTTHPGEKRLLRLAEGCEKSPPCMAQQVRALLQATCSADRGLVLRCAGELLDSLDQLLVAEGLLESVASS